MWPDSASTVSTGGSTEPSLAIYVENLSKPIYTCARRVCVLWCREGQQISGLGLQVGSLTPRHNGAVCGDDDTPHKSRHRRGRGELFACGLWWTSHPSSKLATFADRGVGLRRSADLPSRLACSLYGPMSNPAEQEEEASRLWQELLQAKPTAQCSVFSAIRGLKKQMRHDRISHLRSIDLDARFVSHTHHRLGSPPTFANLRCGAWYVPPSICDGTCYFKSTDGHTGNWGFSLSRLNLQVALAAAASGRVLVVDSTRSGKRYPDALSKRAARVAKCGFGRASYWAALCVCRPLARLDHPGRFRFGAP